MRGADPCQAQRNRQARPRPHDLVIARIRRLLDDRGRPVDHAGGLARRAPRRRHRASAHLVGQAIMGAKLARGRIGPALALLFQPRIECARQREMDLRIVARGLCDGEHANGAVGVVDQAVRLRVATGPSGDIVGLHAIDTAIDPQVGRAFKDEHHFLFVTLGVRLRRAAAGQQRVVADRHAPQVEVARETGAAGHGLARMGMQMRLAILDVGPVADEIGARTGGCHGDGTCCRSDALHLWLRRDLFGAVATTAGLELRVVGLGFLAAA